MNANLVHKELAYEIVGAAMEVLNVHGHGLNEKIYENSLVVEFKLRGLRPDQQKRFTVRYKETEVGLYVPDLLVNDLVIVDAKVVESIGDAEIGQVMNYLRIAKQQLAIILNFRYPKLEYRRVVLSD
jgi:GxxExxY protein